MTKIIQPTYPVKLPSSGKTVTYRPFTVKEEKSLLLSLQEDNIASTIEAIKSVIVVCTDGQVDPNTTPYYDIEFLFLQIRSKSVGEVIDLVGSCECDPTAKTEFSIDIGDLVIVPTPKGNAKLNVLDTPYIVEMSHPSISDFIKTFSDSDDSASEVVANCIRSVYTEDEIMDWSYAEKLNFVQSMSPKQQTNIAKFLEEMPMVKLNSTYTCNKCGKNHSENISGLESFFI